MAKKKQNIDIEEQRYGLFMTEKSYNLDIMYGRHYLQSDNVQTVKIYKMNIIETKGHKLYGQAKQKDKKFFAPVTISVMLNIENSVQTNYGDSQGGIARDDTGKLIFGVYLSELEEKNLEINRGDYVEYNMSGGKSRFYEIENANNIVDETKKTIGGFKPYWKQITAVPVKSDVLNYFDSNKGE